MEAGAAGWQTAERISEALLYCSMLAVRVLVMLLTNWKDQLRHETMPCFYSLKYFTVSLHKIKSSIWKGSHSSYVLNLFLLKLSALLVIIWAMSYHSFTQEVKEPALNFRLDVKITFKGFHNNLLRWCIFIQCAAGFRAWPLFPSAQSIKSHDLFGFSIDCPFLVFLGFFLTCE